MEIAERLDLPAQVRQDLFYAALLKDAGCSSSSARMAELFDTDDRDAEARVRVRRLDQPRRLRPLRREATSPPTRRASRGPASSCARCATIRREAADLNEARCDRGARIVAQLGFSPAAARRVRALDEHWDGSGRPDGLRGRRDPADLAHHLPRPDGRGLHVGRTGPQAALEVVRARRGRWFDPEIADVFLSIGPDDPLWMRLVGRRRGRGAPRPRAGGRASPSPTRAASTASPRRSRSVIDAKSPYTARHSLGVATYAVAIGAQARLRRRPAAEPAARRRCCTTSASSASRTGSSTSPAKLTDDGVRRRSALHPRYTFQILSPDHALRATSPRPPPRTTSGSTDAATTAASAREHLSPEARILAVADVFDALTADRPYRRPLDPDVAFEILWKDAGAAFDPVLHLGPRGRGDRGRLPRLIAHRGRHVTISRVGFVRLGKELMRDNDLRHRSPQPRHGLDRLGDGLCRAARAARPGGAVRAGPARRDQRPGALGAGPQRRPRAGVPRPRDAARAGRDAPRPPDGQPQRLAARRRHRDGGRPTSTSSRSSTTTAPWSGILTARDLARRYIKESGEPSSFADRPASADLIVDVLGGRDARAARRAASTAASGRSRWTPTSMGNTMGAERHRGGGQPHRRPAPRGRARRRPAW